MAGSAKRPEDGMKTRITDEKSMEPIEIQENENKNREACMRIL
jgi:hypothetical protein